MPNPQTSINPEERKRMIGDALRNYFVAYVDLLNSDKAGAELLEKPNTMLTVPMEQRLSVENAQRIFQAIADKMPESGAKGEVVK